MGRHRTKLVRLCPRCKRRVPTTRATQARYCSRRCYKRANFARWRKSDPLYFARYYHLRVYGHTKYVESPMSNPYDRFRRARAEGYRSGLEVAIAKQLEQLGIPFEYETLKIPFTQPSKPRHYKPDYVLPNGVVIETKGRLITADRQKHLHIKEQHPDLDLRFLFSNSATRISKRSKTSYADWCTHKGFKFAQKSIPAEWLKEPPNEKSLAAIRSLQQGKSK